MKKLVMLSSLVIGAMLMFPSCEKIKDLTDIDFDTDLKADVSTMSEGTPVSAGLKSAAEQGYAFEGSAVIDPTSDSQVNKYWKKIRTWEIKKIQVKIKNIDHDAVLKEGKFEIKDDSTGDVLFTENVQNKQLSHGTIVMTISGAEWSKVTDALDAKHSLRVGVEGTLDQPAVSVTYEVMVSVKVTANIFNK